MLATASLAWAVALLPPGVRARLSAGGPPTTWTGLAWLVATVATLGSLTYSEVYGFEPCRLCWYQRILMYPLVLVLAVGWWNKDPDVRRYGLPLAGLGMLVSAYHYLIQMFPTLDAGACGLGVPCSARYVEVLGFISIPLMAFAGFAAIVASLRLIPKGGR